MSARHWAEPAALALPIVAAACLVLALEAAEWSGSDRWADTRPRNAAEAAALGRTADLVRSIRRGDHPEQIFPVRPGTIPEAPAWLSAIEGAMWADGPATIRLIEREGAVLTPSRRRDLACLALDLSRKATADYLSGSSAPSCEPGAALEKVRARTGPS